MEEYNYFLKKWRKFEASPNMRDKPEYEFIAELK